MELGEMFQIFEKLGESKVGKFFQRGVYNQCQDATEYKKYEIFFGLDSLPLTDGFGPMCIARLKVHDVTWIINFSLTIYDTDGPGENYIKINGRFDPEEKDNESRKLVIEQSLLKRTEHDINCESFWYEGKEETEAKTIERFISEEEVKTILEILLTDSEYGVEKWPEPDPIGPASRYE